jgi:hypothetical protein
LDLLLDFNTVDSFRTILRGVDIISDPVSNIPEENDRTELFELDLALVLWTLLLLVDFLEVDEDERGLPIKPNENFFDIVSCSTVNKEDRGSDSLGKTLSWSKGSNFTGGESGFKWFIGTCC